MTNKTEKNTEIFTERFTRLYCQLRVTMVYAIIFKRESAIPTAIKYIARPKLRRKPTIGSQLINPYFVFQSLLDTSGVKWQPSPVEIVFEIIYKMIRKREGDRKNR